MVKLIFSLVFLIASMHSLSAQEWQLHTLPPFNKIEVSGAIDVRLSQGNSYSLSGSNKAIENLKWEVKNGVLELSSDRSISFIGRWAPVGYIEINCQDLSSIQASGASKLKGGNLMFFENISLTSSGAAEISLELETKYIAAKSSGGSNITLRGKADRINARASGGSDIQARHFKVRIADLVSSGGADITIEVSEKLNASASGGSDIYYYGNPTEVQANSTGGSDIKVGNKKIR